MTAEKIVEYLSDKEELFNRLIEELDSYDGYLDEDRWIPMYELNEVLSQYSPDEIIRMAGGSFDLNDEYFRFDGYGSLESAYDLDYSDHLDEYFVKDLVENRRHVDINDPELEYMLRQLEKGEYE